MFHVCGEGLKPGYVTIAHLKAIARQFYIAATVIGIDPHNKKMSSACVPSGQEFPRQCVQLAHQAFSCRAVQRTMVYEDDNAAQWTNQTHLRRSELQMTETELKAMAAAAIQGARSTPTGTRVPAAIGIPVCSI